MTASGSSSHAASSSPLAVSVGNEPITPLRHAATTKLDPETYRIGAAISGNTRSQAPGSATREAYRCKVWKLVFWRQTENGEVLSCM